MSIRLRSLGLIVVSAAVITLSACFPAAPEPSFEDVDAEPVTTPEAPEPSETVAPPASAQFGWMDEQGYSASIELVYPPLEFRSEIANAAPGFTDLVSDYDVSGELTNTTSGRTTSIAANFFHVVAYPADSAVCMVSDDQWSDWALQLNRGTNHCYLAFGLTGLNSQLQPEQSVPIRSTSASNLTIPAVSETEAPLLLSALNTPVGYGVVSETKVAEVLEVNGFTGICEVLTPNWRSPHGDVLGAEVLAISDPAACS